MASVGVLRCLAMSGELLTTLEAVDGFDAQVGPDPFSVIELGLVGVGWWVACWLECAKESDL